MNVSERTDNPNELKVLKLYINLQNFFEIWQIFLCYFNKSVVNSVAFVDILTLFLVKTITILL